MQSNLALHVPQRGSYVSAFRVACIDLASGIRAVDLWGRLGWRETKRRYRRTVFGPFWSTAGLALFVTTLGLVWTNLWHQNVKEYLPYLTAGMICWVLFSMICTEGCGVFIVSEKLLKQLRISYTLLACTNVWRNTIIFAHNMIIYVAVCLYAGVAVTWSTLLFIPAFALFCANAIWINLILGAFCARFRDIQQLVVTLLQISLFLTPIFWQPSQLTGRTAILAKLNPLYHLVSIIRDPLLGKAPEPLTWVAVLVMAVVGWSVTIYMMTKFRHRIVYWI